MLLEAAGSPVRSPDLRQFHAPLTQTAHAFAGDADVPPARRYVDDMVTVSDEDLVHTMRFLWERMKAVLEMFKALPEA